MIVRLCGYCGQKTEDCECRWTTDVLEPLTFQESECLHFINVYIEEHGFSPSVRDISRAMKHSGLNWTRVLLETLVRFRYIKFEAGKSRTIRVIGEEACIK